MYRYTCIYKYRYTILGNLEKTHLQETAHNDCVNYKLTFSIHDFGRVGHAKVLLLLLYSVCMV